MGTTYVSRKRLSFADNQLWVTFLMKQESVASQAQGIDVTALHTNALIAQKYTNTPHFEGTICSKMWEDGNSCCASPILMLFPGQDKAMVFVFFSAP